ncbi:hypothetical protein QBC33DRAFT_559933 [Phialemonium atrogriseum]|uniref:Uncharacterized protein n=1 Tax=Phialemonium atrogriseum TaxID=1093897 RepID=A0AAJ0BZC0_9PEZI|nr:uncharacterized protein QBC33DRAFT_559933 [Phialemonium atrogriseum]KAK1766622.1 hypothetical protein QBC33DRAFT_559933 [Phialemonium atrogriseum]
MTVLIHLSRPLYYDQVDCNIAYNSTFGSPFYLAGKLKNSFGSGGTGESAICLTWGTVYFTAGVVKAPKSTFVSPQTVEFDPTTLSHDGDISAAIEPSIWTREALWLMQDVMPEIAVLNATRLPTWENLDNYTATLIRHAYFAGWETFHASFEYTDDGQLTARPAEARLEASVSFPRLFAWFGVTLFLPLSGLIMLYLRLNCKRSMIVDTAALLFTDAREMIEKHPHLTEMAVVTQEDKAMGPLKLRSKPGVEVTSEEDRDKGLVKPGSKPGLGLTSVEDTDKSLLKRQPGFKLTLED